MNERYETTPAPHHHEDMPVLPAYDIAADYAQCSEHLAKDLKELDAMAKADKRFNNWLNGLRYEYIV
jgi:hypothetical protein